MGRVIEITPDNGATPDERFPSIFLAGTIDMGEGELWQERVLQRMQCSGLCANVYNPRREKFELTEESQNFQINWELDLLLSPKLDIIFMYFSPGSKSPITLLELGFSTSNPDKVILMCNDGFYRYLNVKFTADRYNIPVHPSLERGYTRLVNKFENVYGQEVQGH